MSVVANFIGTLEKPVYNASLTGTASTVYTVPSTNKGLTLAAFTFSNTGGGTSLCGLYHNDGTTDWLVWINNLSNNTTEVVSGTPIRLLPGDIIKAVGGTGVTVKLDLISQLPTRPA